MTHASLISIIIISTLSAIILLLPMAKRHKKFAVLLLCLCLFAEVFVCNFHSFHLLFRGYEETTLSLSEEEKGNLSQITLSYEGLDKKVGTVYFDILLDSDPDSVSDSISVNIDAKDETYAANYRYGVAKGVIVRGSERSQTVVLNLSGKVSDLRITLSSQQNKNFKLNDVKINSPVPFEISFLRFALIFLFIFAIYALFNFKAMTTPVSEQKGLFARLVFAITAILFIIALCMTMIYNLNGEGVLFSSFKQESGNQISQELVDAFENKQVSLLDKPTDELLALKNPYDWGERINTGIYYKWDHLLFEGKYYSYYGIAPVFLLFLPYHLFTGFYFPTPEAVLLFGIVGIMFLSLIFYELTKKLFPNLQLNVAISSLVVLQMSSGIWYCFLSPLFYEIAQSSGFAFTCAGFYFLLRSNVVLDGKTNKYALALSSICLSCAVLCRPTLAVYCITALIFIALGFVKMRKEALADGTSVNVSSVSYLLYALVPFVAIGLCQMIYNYVRFDSFFDFGIQYSLTINDFTKAEYHTDFTFIGFWNYLFAFPNVTTEFPFVFSNFSDLNTNGYYFIANRNAIGIFYRALPSIGLLLSPIAFKCSNKKKLLIPTILIASVCVVCPLVIIFSIWESGYGVRYAADFSWQIIIGGMLVIYYLFYKNKLDSNTFAKKTFEIFFVYSAIIAVIFNGALLYDYFNKSGNLASEFISLEKLFEFWR